MSAMTDETLAEILGLAIASSPCDGYGAIPKDDAAGLADKTAKLDGTPHDAKLWCSYLRVENAESLIAAITGNGPTSEANARFYSCARGAVIELVEEVRGLRARLRRAEQRHLEPDIVLPRPTFQSATPCLGNTTDGGVCMMRKGHDGRCP